MLNNRKQPTTAVAVSERSESSFSRRLVTAAAIGYHDELREAEKMPRISEKNWKSALTDLLEELDKPQYSKMLLYLTIPKSQKSPKQKANMPQTIIEHYGVEQSILEVSEVMDKIPRKDSAVQDLLRPFVDKVRSNQEKEKKGTKRKQETDSRSANKKQKSADDELKSHKSDKENVIQTWRTTIEDLKITHDATKKTIFGKVVQKSGLRTYQTKDQKKFFFYLAVADDTDIIKVMVYGKERFQQFKEENFYTFRNVLMENSIMKVTKCSTISDTGRFDVPGDLDLKARLLLYSSIPVCSIATACSYDDKTLVSVMGTVTEIRPLEHVKLKTKRRNKAKQDFKLQDKTGSIRITLWGDDTQRLRGISSGDYVMVANVKTNHYYDTVSLNSTDYTRIVKMQSAAVQNVRIEIIGIINAGRTDTELEAEISQQVQTLVVASSSLQKAFYVRLDGDFKERLLEKIPLSAYAEIQGKKIIRIEAV
ncbi:uncharacterized protein LOC110945844 [Acanthochromis polyacanthus]|uniref:uncharacterized protein LOC110945844 n=1 Tax=Acanthochromis polyacanthus TaxID=80966 RepID=UPI002234E19C|nr:uncharacterized protein LOC110945844 [Acanthochromis polyacanthus]